MAREPPRSPREYLERYPKLCAHVMAETLAPMMPLVSTIILYESRDTEYRTDWRLYHRGDPQRMVERAIRNRRKHGRYTLIYEWAISEIKRQLSDPPE